MHEDRKLKEAWFYLSEMHTRQRHPSAFIHLLSGFLSAARSVAQYPHKEATSETGGQAWYDGAVAKHPSIGYFKAERDVNIHTKPVDPTAVWKVAGSIPMLISGGADYGVKFLDGNGQPVEINIKAAPPPPPPPPPVEPEPEVRYEFADRPNESILTLCENYLKLAWTCRLGSPRKGLRHAATLAFVPARSRAVATRPWPQLIASSSQFFSPKIEQDQQFRLIFGRRRHRIR